MVGPPIAGALDASYGFRAPFYFSIAFAGLDLIIRLLVIERKDAIPWGVDPAADPDEVRTPSPASDSPPLTLESGSPSVGLLISPTDTKGAFGPGITISQAPSDDVTQHTITPLDVLFRLLTSPRAVVCIFSTFAYG